MQEQNLFSRCRTYEKAFDYKDYWDKIDYAYTSKLTFIDDTGPSVSNLELIKFMILINI